MIVAGLVILVVAIVGITYAVITKQGDEGFLKHEGKDIVWDTENFPLICTVDESVTEGHLARYMKAKNEINTQVGKQLLSTCVEWAISNTPMPEYIPGALTVRVSVPKPSEELIVDDPFSVHPGGITRHQFNKNTGMVISAAVWIDPNNPENLVDRIWLHELGHVLGLAHDRLTNSVMYSKASDRPSRLSKKDIDLLKKTYLK